MSNNPFDQTILNARERPLSSDINQAQSQLFRTERGMLYFEKLRRTSSGGNAPIGITNDGFLNDGYKVFAFAGMQVAIQSGLGFYFDSSDVPGSIDGIVGLSDLSPYKPMQLVLPTLLTVPAAPGPGLTRFDIIEAKPYRRTENPLSRDVLDPATGAFTPQLVNKTMAWAHDGETGIVVSPANSTEALSYKTGVAGVVGTIPATSPGYTRIAIIKVATGTLAITEAMIRDTRKMVTNSGVEQVSFYFDFKTGANPPANVDVIAPPGVRAALVHPAGFNHVIQAYIIAEGVRAVSMTLNGQTIGALAPVLADSSSTDPARALIPQDITDLANAAVSTPVIAAFNDAVVAPQECVYSQVGFVEWDIATQQWVALAHDVDNMSLQFNLLL